MVSLILCSLAPPAFAGRALQPLHVVLVATHADLANVPRAASGEFTYAKEKVLLKEVRNRSGDRALHSQTVFISEIYVCLLISRRVSPAPDLSDLMCLMKRQM